MMFNSEKSLNSGATWMSSAASWLLWVPRKEVKVFGCPWEGVVARSRVCLGGGSTHWRPGLQLKSSSTHWRRRPGLQGAGGSSVASLFFFFFGSLSFDEPASVCSPPARLPWGSWRRRPRTQSTDLEQLITKPELLLPEAAGHAWTPWANPSDSPGEASFDFNLDSNNVMWFQITKIF